MLPIVDPVFKVFRYTSAYGVDIRNLIGFNPIRLIAHDLVHVAYWNHAFANVWTHRRRLSTA